MVLAPGVLVFQDSFYSRLVAAPVDPATLELAGPAVPLLQGVSTAAAQNYAVSRSGTLVYFAAGGGEGENRLVRVGFDGTVTTLVERRGNWFQPRTSPDGRHLAVREVGDECRLWLLDLVRETLTPLTADGDNHQPAWTRDGRQVAYGREDLAGGVRGLFLQKADGSGGPVGLLGWEPERASPSLSVPYPDSFSPGDRELLFEQSTLGTGSDLWVLSRERSDAAPFLATPAVEGDGAFSPDGRWVAYVSDESGRQEVYVRGFPQGQRVQISVVGGESPIWSHDGKRLYFSHFRRVMAVEFEGRGNEPTVGRPQEVVRGFDFERGSFDLLPDGESFVLAQPATPGVVEIRVVTGWARELREALPEGRQG
jgi:serine/threonine-protein kinase